MGQAKTAEGAPDRYAMDGHLVLICNFENQIIQCEIWLGSHPYRDPIAQPAQLAMTAAIALGTRLQPACLALQQHHVVDELHRNPQPRSGSSG